METAERELLSACGITDIDELSRRCMAARTAMGQPTTRWAPQCLSLAIRMAVVNRGWPAGHVQAALLDVAADRRTRSPVRVAEAGPWWDSPTDTDAAPDDDLPVLEERLAELGGHRPRLQAQARAELADEGLPPHGEHRHQASSADPRPRRRAGMTSTAPARPHPRRAAGRHRDHQQPARTRAMLLRYLESEFADIGAAAREAGLTPSGYAADAALAMATGAQPPTTAPWRSVLLELMDARCQVRRIGANVNQAARVLNSTGEPPVWLEQVMAVAARAVLSLEGAANAVGHVAKKDRHHGQRQVRPRSVEH